MSDSTARPFTFATDREVVQVISEAGALLAQFDEEGNLEKNRRDAVAFILASRTSTIKELSGEGARAIEDAVGLCQSMCLEITTLRKALEPFADLVGEGDEDYEDTEKVVVKFGRTTCYMLSLRDLRRASAALKDSPPLTVEEKP